MRPVTRREKDPYVDSNDVVLRGEDGLVVEDLQQSRGLPVQDQAAGVDGPPEVVGKFETQQLLGDDGDVGHVERHMGHQALERLIAAALGRDNGRVARRVSLVGLVVSDNASDVGCVAVVRAGRVPTRSQPVVAGLGVGLDDDVVPLADADQDAVRLVGDDRDKVGGDDSQAMAVDGELKVAVGRDVDNAHTVLLSSLKVDFKLLATADTLLIGRAGAVERVCAVDEAVLHDGRTTLPGLVPQGEGLGMRPVLEEHGSQVLVIVGRSRTVDVHGAEQPLSILQSEMTVVPGAAVLSRAELVSELRCQC